MKPLDHWITGTIVLLALSSIVFLLYPQIDLIITREFWDGNNFLFQKNGIGTLFTVYLHQGMRFLFFTYLIAGASLLAISTKPSWFKIGDYLFIVLTVALAAGLVTNVIFKDHWGRARPNQIIEFGGTKDFTPAWVISTQCDRNCSFVGGDVSFAFCALAPAVMAENRRKVWIVLSIMFGCLVGFGRIAAGAHFLSDCVVAALVTAFLILSLNKIRLVYFP